MHAAGIQARRRAPPLSPGLHQHRRQLLPAWGPAEDGVPGAADPGIPYQCPHLPHLPYTVPTGAAVIPTVPCPCCLPHSKCLCKACESRTQVLSDWLHLEYNLKTFNAMETQASCVLRMKDCCLHSDATDMMHGPDLFLLLRHISAVMCIHSAPLAAACSQS